MKVKITSEINVEADTIEEALAEVRKQLHFQYESSLDDALADDYRHWNVENDGDVDWIPFHLTRTRSNSIFRVVNRK